MKKRINLFNKRTSASIPNLIFEKIKIGGTVISVGLFIVFLVFIVLQIQQKNEYNTLLSKKQALLNFFLENKDDQAKYAIFTSKNNLLKKDLKDDAEFLPYYNLLKDLLGTSSNSALLESMNIDKEKKTDFSVRFLSYDPAYQFIRYIETNDAFLKSFQDLTLESFAVSHNSVSKESGYELKFEGKFNKLTNEPKL